jgi:hypothetical protein
MIENSENDAKVMEVPPNFFTCLGENVDKLIETWNPGITNLTNPDVIHDCIPDCICLSCPFSLFRLSLAHNLLWGLLGSRIVDLPNVTLFRFNTQQLC